MFNRWMPGMIAGAVFCLLGIGGTAYGDPALADPTRPGIMPAGTAQQASEKAASLILNSTLISQERRVAVINGQVVQEGQIVSGATLVAIGPGVALLRRAGEKIRLTLTTDTVKRAVKQVP